MTDHRAEADRLMRKEEPYATEYLLAAIHDEQQAQTGLLTDLRGAIDDLAEALRPKGDHDRTGSRCMRPNCMELHDPEPESVTVTLPRDVVEAYTSDLWRQTAFDLRHSGERKAAGVLDALADALDAATTPSAPPAAHESDDQPSQAPADGEGAERPTAANLTSGQCPPPDEYVTILRADYDRLLDHQPAEEVVVRRDDVRGILAYCAAERSHPGAGVFERLASVLGEGGCTHPDWFVGFHFLQCLSCDEVKRLHDGDCAKCDRAALDKEADDARD